MVTITRRLEFDAGHRIPHHANQCRHLHGHRYALELTVVGALVEVDGAPDQAMVADFSEVKSIANRIVVQPWDHAFLAWKHDRQVVDFLATLPGHRTVEFEQPPTAEHLAATAFELLQAALAERYGSRVTLSRVRLYETPNAWADAGPGDR
ncbi:MAG: 6-carboxytetrahydropterin synthase [Proteobacteria bacterium]|nr:6-carboxytetrahydropterin synthase [Pseudomonadota bacterium]